MKLVALGMWYQVSVVEFNEAGFPWRFPEFARAKIRPAGVRPSSTEHS